MLSWNDLGPLVPHLAESVSANQYKVIPGNHIYLVITQSGPAGSALSKHDDALSTGRKGSLKGLISMTAMWVICCSFHSHHVMQHSSPISSKYSKEGISFGRIVFIPPVELHWDYSGWPQWHKPLQRHLNVGFCPFLCLLTTCMSIMLDCSTPHLSVIWRL